MKKLLSLLTLAAILMTVLAVLPFASHAAPAVIGEVADGYTPAEGSVAISSVAEFEAMQKDTNYHLTQDLDFSGKTYDGKVVPVADFNGTLDGCGYALKGITITSGGDAGIFDLWFKGTLKNISLGVEGAPISITGTNGDASVGVVSGTSGDCTFDNVSIYANVDAQGKTAGFMAYMSDATITINNCEVRGSIKGGATAGFVVTTSGHPHTMNLTITNSVNYADISSYTIAPCGGFYTRDVDSGELRTTNVTITGCANYGNITANDWRVGGIVGEYSGKAESTLLVDHCYNAGDITMINDGGFAAGIVGGIGNNNDPTGARVISNCYNIGKITHQVRPTERAYDITYYDRQGGAYTVKNCIGPMENKSNLSDSFHHETNLATATDASEILSFLAAYEPENAEVTFVADSENINGGYPVLSWQVVEEPEDTTPDTEPEEQPLLKTDKTEYAVGESVKVTAIGSGKDWVGIYYVGDPHSIRWEYVETLGSGVEFDIWADTQDNGSSPETLGEGRYVIRLMPNDTSDLSLALAEIEITVGDPSDNPVVGDTTRLSIEKTEFTVGEAIKVTAVGSGTDWLGIYEIGAEQSLRWVYIDAVGSGVEFDAWGQAQKNDGVTLDVLPAGSYIIRLMPNDQTDHGLAVASVVITVTAPVAPDPEPEEIPAFSEGTIEKTDEGKYTIASDGFSAFISTRRNATNAAHNDIRIILATDIEGLDAYAGLNLILTFKKDGEVVKTGSWDVVEDLDIYASAIAAGNTYTAADGCALFGIVITSVPNADWDEIIATVTDDTGKGVGEGSAEADGLVVPAPVDIKGELGSLIIEDQHASLDKWPSLVFFMGNTTLWQTLRGDKENYPDNDHWSNPAYKWVLIVNGEEIVPEKFSIYDGDAWGYFRAAIAPKDALDYVDNTATLDITLNIYDNATGYLMYFADLDPLTYERPIVPVHDPIHIDSAEGVTAALWGTPFETPGGLGGKAALIYRVTGIFETINGYITDEVAYAKVTLNGTVYTIKNYENGGDIFRFDVQSEGAVIYSGLTYTVKVEIYNTNDQLLYYSNEYTCVSTLTSSNAAERSAMNVTLPDSLTKLTVDTSRLSTENINHWGDGPVANLFDGKTGVGGSAGSKMGGNKGAGDPTVYFSLSEAATVSYFTFTTGGDTGSYKDRNPYGFTLYGKVDGEWVILADIRDNETNVTGFTPANSTPYSYATSNPQACIEYKVVLYTGGGFQLNELELYAG